LFPYTTLFRSSSLHRHHDARPRHHALEEGGRDLVGVGARYGHRKDDLGEPGRPPRGRPLHRFRTPSPGPVGRRILPPSIVAPLNGSFAVSAAPSRSAASTSGVK